MEVLLALLSFMVAGVFIGHFCIVKKGAPESISSLVYEMKHKWLWSVWIVAVGMLLFPRLMTKMPEMWQFVGFLMILALIGTALTPLFVSEKRTAHYIIGSILGLLVLACVYIISPWWLLVLIPVVPLTGMSMSDDCPKWLDGKILFFAELACLIALYGSLI